MDTIDTLKEAQKKGGKNRWNNIPEKKRKEMMREVALKRWAKNKESLTK